MTRRLKGTLDIIRFFIESEETVDSSIIDFAIDRKGDRYLLGQFMRHVLLPKENYYVSKKAMAKWEELGHEKDEIFNVFYRCKVKNNAIIPIDISRYKGAAAQPWNTEQKKLNMGASFHYREVFHDEHITTIQGIINKLFSLNTFDDESILNVLKTIKIAKILKEEDRRISRLKKDLPQDIDDEVIKVYYKEKDIDLVSFAEWAENK